IDACHSGHFAARRNLLGRVSKRGFFCLRFFVGASGVDEAFFFHQTDGAAALLWRRIHSRRAAQPPQSDLQGEPSVRMAIEIAPTVRSPSDGVRERWLEFPRISSGLPSPRLVSAQLSPTIVPSTIHHPPSKSGRRRLLVHLHLVLAAPGRRGGAELGGEPAGEGAGYRVAEQVGDAGEGIARVLHV